MDQDTMEQLSQVMKDIDKMKHLDPELVYDYIHKLISCEREEKQDQT